MHQHRQWVYQVLPVVCPDLSYDDLDVHDGASAMEAWERMARAEGDEQNQIEGSLLAYCERDTFAMVEIHRFLVILLQD